MAKKERKLDRHRLVFLGLSALVVMLLTYLLIAHTPLRHTIPGYPDRKTQQAAIENYRKVEAEVNRVFSRMTSDEVEERMLKSKSVYGRINNFEGLKNHPQMKYRKSLVNATYPNGISFQVPNNPIVMSGMERETEYTAAPLGANTIEVLSEVADPAAVHEIFDPVLEKVRQTARDMYSKS